jgi:hypothetical protein
MNSSKNAHGKSIRSINQRRGSGIGASISNPSSIITASTSAANYTSNNLNKSYQNLSKAAASSNNNDHKNSS